MIIISNQYTESMLDMYLFETNQNIEQLETCVLESEKLSSYDQKAINEIFRIMHTIKGSSAMMLYNNISVLAHTMEDLFNYLREQKPKQIDYSTLTNFILEGVDFIRAELEKISAGESSDGDSSSLARMIKDYLGELTRNNTSNQSSKKNIEKGLSKEQLQYYIAPDKPESDGVKNAYKATIFFEDGCEMENIRAFAVIHNLKDISYEVYYLPEDIIDNDESILVIRERGFQIYLTTEQSLEQIHDFFNQIIFLKDLDLVQLDNEEELKQFQKQKKLVVEPAPIKVPTMNNREEKDRDGSGSSASHGIISVNVAKLDKLMDLVGELVIAEAMVTQNPDLQGLELGNFRKAARQLHKITNELQDTVMSVRMVPLSITFHKMQRIIRDMSKKLNKDVQLELVGEDTEVDKNIIEHLSDPLMHLVRNAIDHGIEPIEVREASGKPRTGKVILEAKNAGSDVIIMVKDDGKGLNKDHILKKAIENNLLTKPANELTEKEIYNLIFVPGFSTKENVTEFSGRGVGMDVVIKNIEAVGGIVSIDSTEGVGTTMIVKIPLTLAIIEGMNIQVGLSHYTIPITTIRESFRPKQSDLIQDPDGYEMIMMRGQCYPILRLHEMFKTKAPVTKFTDGIFIMVEQDEKSFCIFADKLLGQQQVVVKTLPNYIRNTGKIHGLAGCTLLGDGNISLILDIGGLAEKTKS